MPSCETGKVRGLLEVEVSESGDTALDPQDCESTVDGATIDNDVEAFHNGFAAIGPVPAQPAQSAN